MADIDEKDILPLFTQVGGVKASDSVLLSVGATESTSTMAGQLPVGLFRAYLTAGMTPYVGSDGTWYVGDTQLRDKDNKVIYATSFRYNVLSELSYQQMAAEGKLQEDTFYFRYEE